MAQTTLFSLLLLFSAILASSSATHCQKGAPEPPRPASRPPKIAQDPQKRAPGHSQMTPSESKLIHGPLAVQIHQIQYFGVCCLWLGLPRVLNSWQSKSIKLRSLQFVAGFARGPGPPANPATKQELRAENLVPPRGLPPVVKKYILFSKWIHKSFYQSIS